MISSPRRFKTLIYLKGFGVGACGALVSTSKSLAQMSKPKVAAGVVQKMHSGRESSAAEDRLNISPTN
jgi:hypothetical protein